jgi:hypothetical protein
MLIGFIAWLAIVVAFFYSAAKLDKHCCKRSANGYCCSRKEHNGKFQTIKNGGGWK